MAVFKCKMCGGGLEINENQSTAVCEYCGTQQTLPKLDDERRANLYDRANHFRRSNEFDKAASIYEQMLNEDSTDAEAYWSLVLCRYGIEYVEDPSTHKRVPTVNRAQFTSVFDDENYKSALANADGLSRTLYEQEATAINELQKGILAISQKEEPFDVFICYKETDSNGRRTPDSVLANDLYHQLTAEGFKVFYSRITLEDKLGVAYEPYIFAALNSAKVMVTIGTKPEYFNAVWVKNEWSRYLSLVKQSGGKKVLIPAYKDMDPYDLPEEFSHLQAQDMSKLGFMQDLIRGIKKLTAAKAEPTVTEPMVTKSETGGNLIMLRKRGDLALEDGEWEKADGFFEQMLYLDAENATAYFGKAMAQQHCRNAEEFIAKRIAAMDSLQPETLMARQPDNAKINDAVKRFTVCGYLDECNIRKVYEYSFAYPSLVSAGMAAKANEEHYWSGDKYLSKVVRFSTGKNNELTAFKQKILAAFDEKIAAEQQKDAAAVKRLLEAYPAHLQQAEERCAKEYAQQHTLRLNNAVAKEQEADKLLEEAQKSGKSNRYGTAKSAYTISKERYTALVPDADITKHIERCDKQLAQIDKEVKELLAAEAKRRAEIKEAEARAKAAAAKKQKKILIITLAALAVAIALSILTGTVFIPAGHYSAAEEALSAGNTAEAAMEFEKAGSYSDAHTRSWELWDAIAERHTLAAGGTHTVGLRTNGTVVAVGNDSGRREVFDWTDIVAIAAGNSHTIGLKADGTAVAVAGFGSDQRDVSDWTDIVAIAAGDYHTVGLRADGTVVATKYTGLFDYGQCDVSGWTDIVAIAAGDTHTVGLRADGTAVVVGDNKEGQCDVSDWTDIVAIAAGKYHTVGLRADGTVVATVYTGYFYNGQCEVSGWTDIVAIAAGIDRTVGLRADGTVVATEFIGNQEKNYGQCDVSDWTDIVTIAAGDYHTVGLRADGTVVAVGDNYYDQCDVSGWTNIKLPTKQ